MGRAHCEARPNCFEIWLADPEAAKLDPKALATWDDITPLARNEWICWVESAKKTETRLKRIDWGRSSLSDGKRRPCCWPGCTHR